MASSYRHGFWSEWRCGACGFNGRTIRSSQRNRVVRRHKQRCDPEAAIVYSSKRMTPDELAFVQANGYGPRHTLNGAFRYRCACGHELSLSTNSARRDSVRAHWRKCGRRITKWHVDRPECVTYTAAKTPAGVDPSERSPIPFTPEDFGEEDE